MFDVGYAVNVSCLAWVCVVACGVIRFVSGFLSVTLTFTVERSAFFEQGDSNLRGLKSIVSVCVNGRVLKC